MYTAKAHKGSRRAGFHRFSLPSCAFSAFVVKFLNVPFSNYNPLVINNGGGADLAVHAAPFRFWNS
jgi:hypothetical protein